MKRIIFIALCFLLPDHSFAQTTTPAADIQKKLDDAMKKDPRLKAFYDQALKGNQQVNPLNLDSLKKEQSKQTGIQTSKTKKEDSTIFALPLRNDKYLNALPIRTFNRAELISYLHNLNIQLTEILETNYGANIKNIPVHTAAEGGKTSIALWINNDPENAALLILKSAEMDPDNNVLLNSVGGILTNDGLPFSAIPVLQYILDKDPANNTILNNIGQAYLSLGDMKTAEPFLLKCIKNFKYHPDANLALAFINNGRGNKAEAILYAENSLRGAYSTDAEDLLDKLKPDAKLMDYIRHRYEEPEYFNFDKYPLLPQCRDTKNTPILRPQYKAYSEMLNDEKATYTKLRKDEETTGQREVTEKMITDAKVNKNPFKPFGVFANAVIADLTANEYADRFLKFAAYKKEYLAKKQQLANDCLAKQEAIAARHKPEQEAVSERDGEGTDGSEYERLAAAICAEKETVKNQYLNLIADINEEFQKRAIILYKNYFNDLAYWYFIASVNEHQYKAEFYGLVLQFLDALSEINTTYFYDPCQPVPPKSSTAKKIEMEMPDCYLPFPIKIPMGMAKLDISCEEYKLEGGEGLVLTGKYNRLNGEVTIAFGPGYRVPDIPEIPFVGLQLGAKITGQAYIKFGRDGSLVDWGLVYAAKIDLKEKLFEVGSTTLEKEEVTMGYNSGVNMKGRLKEKIDKLYYVQPDAKQINKNVPLYRK